MPAKNLICIVIDRLHAGMIGAYGNSWIRTGNFDELASDSFVFDQALINSPELDDLYRAYWLGQTATREHEPSTSGASFPQLAQAAGWHTALITDEGHVIRHPLAAGFAEHVFVEPPSEERTADEIPETQLARLFGTATSWLQAVQQPFCLWIHAQGMAAAWDGPLELRNAYAEDEDPQPPDFAAVPNRWLAEKFDADEVLGITHAYAGQVSLFDLCLGALLDQLHQSELRASTQLTLLSARGFPLGEHRRIGPCDEALYNELTQIPWLMRFPDGFGKLARSQALVQPTDLPGTLLEWLDVDRAQLGSGSASSLFPVMREERESLREVAYLVSQADRAIRTPAWYLRRAQHGTAELYAKPSDRWEVNDVANRCPDIATDLLAILSQVETNAEGAQLPPLSEALITEID